MQGGGGPEGGGVRIPELLRDIGAHLCVGRMSDKDRAKLLERVRGVKSSIPPAAQPWRRNEAAHDGVV